MQNLQVKNKEVYKILLESQLQEKPIVYTKWENFLKKDRMHTKNFANVHGILIAKLFTKER
jgi:hypothetical protein